MRVCLSARVSLLSQYSRPTLEIHHTTDVCTTNEYTQTSPAVNFNNALSFSDLGAFKTLAQAHTYSCKFLIIDQWACLPALDNCHPRGRCVTPHSWQRAQVEKREEQSLSLCPLLTLHLCVALIFTSLLSLEFSLFFYSTLFQTSSISIKNFLHDLNPFFFLSKMGSKS